MPIFIEQHLEAILTFVGLLLTGGPTVAILNARLNRHKTLLDEKVTEKQLDEKTMLAANAVVDMALKQMTAQSSLLTEAYDTSSRRITDMQQIITLLQSRHLKVEDRQGQLETANVRLEGDVRLLQTENTALTQSHQAMRTDYEAKLQTLWDYTLAWETAIELEDGETQARIRLRIDKDRPANGHRKH